MKMTGNTILITGGTSGIGRALAEEFHKRGNQVIIAGRRQQQLDEITAANPGMAGLPLDVDDAMALDDFGDQIAEQYPALNVLINNAGISRAEDYTGEFVEIDPAESIIQTNITSVLRLTAGLLPLLKNQPQATIMTTTSGLAFVPMAAYPTYCASKAFLHSWIQSLRVQLRETTVEVLELAPPYVQTELTGSAQAADPAAMPLADFIAEVMTLLESSKTPGDEILVERVKGMRVAEQTGVYEEVFKRINGG